MNEADVRHSLTLTENVVSLPFDTVLVDTLPHDLRSIVKGRLLESTKKRKNKVVGSTSCLLTTPSVGID